MASVDNAVQYAAAHFATCRKDTGHKMRRCVSTLIYEGRLGSNRLLESQPA